MYIYIYIYDILYIYIYIHTCIYVICIYSYTHTYKGAFGKVNIGVHKMTEELTAMKLCERKRIAEAQEVPIIIICSSSSTTTTTTTTTTTITTTTTNNNNNSNSTVTITSVIITIIIILQRAFGEAKKCLGQEVSILRKLNGHANIIQLYEVIETSSIVVLDTICYILSYDMT